jgi:hypothetical protein
MGKLEMSIDDAKDLTLCIATGQITIDNIYTAAQQYLVDKPTSKVLWDARNAVSFVFTAEDIRMFHLKFSSFSNPLNGKKIAIVVSRSIGCGLLPLTAAYIESLECRDEYNIFRSLKEAMGWLDI